MRHGLRVLLAGHMAVIGVLWFGAVLVAPVDAAETSCFGRTPTIVGTEGDDYLVAEPGVVNVIYGAGGNDTIWGASNPDANNPGDYLCGGPGHDFITGGTGDDHVSGGDDSDGVSGGTEDSGNDIVYGNAGNDAVEDTNECEFPDDTGTDVLIGGAGSDYVCSDAGSDVLYGRSGNDLLHDFTDEASRLYGGPGNDELTSWSQPRRASLPDFVSGDDGFDRATVSRNDKVRATERVAYCCTAASP